MSLPARPAPRGRAAARAVLLVASLAALATGCSVRRVAETLLLGDHFHLDAGLPYGADPRQRLDVYRPRQAGGPLPVVVFLYGGRWQSGSRREYRLLGDALTRRGFVVVIPDYRLHPPLLFPGWVRDAAAAIRWTHDNAARFGGDPRHLVLVGHSAGAHSAALLALDERFLREAGVPPGVVRGAAALAGPVDTVWTDPDVQTLMGPREGWPDTYPASFVDGTEPPLLLLHGGADETVSPGGSTRLARRIRDRGGCARAVLYPGVGHVGIVVALAVPRLRRAPVLEEVAAFARDPAGRACPGPG